MRRALWFLLAALIPLSQAGAAIEEHFVRSEADCAANGCGLENGSSFANAWRTHSDVSYSGADGTTTAVDPEDILYNCSPVFTAADLDTATVMIAPSANISGTASAKTRITGDCSAFGGPSMAKLDGGGTATRGVDLGSTNRTYIQIDSLEITGFTDAGILNQGAVTDSDYWLIDNVWVHDCRGATSQGYWGRGGYVTIQNSTFERTGEDNIWNEGDYFTAINNTLREPGLDAGGLQGDNIQIGGVAQAVGFDIRDNDMQTSVDVKQCVLAGTSGLPVSGVLLDNKCDGPGANAESHSSYFFNGTGTVVAERNYAKKSRYLIYAAAGVSLLAFSNIGHDFTAFGIQCGTGGADCTIENNSVARAPVCFSTESASGTNTIRNNVGIGCTTSGIRKNAGDVESHNTIYQSGDLVQNETTTTTPGTGTTTADPKLIGGMRPSTPDDFRPGPGPGSPLCGVGTLISRGMNDYFGQNFPALPPIGAVRCPDPRVDMTEANRIDLTAANRVDMTASNRVTRTEANTLRLQ